ncbi:MAG: hypothetical protein QG670_2592 [Thermoproteota archaeon]|nr:hypothetical protein [Thermoproteota archaeon]
MIVVRKLEEYRWSEYRDLRLEALNKESIAFSSSYDEEKNLSEEEWRRRTKNLLFALSEDKLIGMIGYIRENKIKTKHVATIFGFYVTLEYRCQEVGTRLIDSLFEQIEKSKDIVKVKLTVIPEQKAAIKLYQNCGFKIVGQLRKELCVEGTFYDELIMEKLL